MTSKETDTLLHFLEEIGLTVSDEPTIEELELRKKSMLKTKTKSYKNLVNEIIERNKLLKPEIIEVNYIPVRKI